MVSKKLLEDIIKYKIWDNKYRLDYRAIHIAIFID
jgi:hypothetical protein